jgi:predicted phosphodiesterase
VENGKLIVAGHTHRPSCPLDPGVPYFNDGSAVHPGSISCLELQNDGLTLVKWSVQAAEDCRLFVKRQQIAVPRKL